MRKILTVVGAVILAGCVAGEQREGEPGGVDSAPLVGDYVDEPVTCEAHTITRNGVTTTHWFKAIEGIDPSDDFFVTSCYISQDFKTLFGYECNAGEAGCSTGGVALPSGQYCFNNRGGSFVNGKLFLQCGSQTAAVDGRMSITLHRR